LAGRTESVAELAAIVGVVAGQLGWAAVRKIEVEVLTAVLAALEAVVERMVQRIGVVEQELALMVTGVMRVGVDFPWEYNLHYLDHNLQHNPNISH
jgi:hypothetical protein